MRIPGRGGVLVSLYPQCSGFLREFGEWSDSGSEDVITFDMEIDTSILSPGRTSDCGSGREVDAEFVAEFIEVRIGEG